MNNGQVETCPLLATADKEGHFLLDTLNSSSTYTLAVERDGFAPTILREVTAGQSINAILKPQIDIQGKIVGGLQRLPADNPMAHICWSIPMGGNGSHILGRDVPIQVRSGFGYFEFTNVFPGEIELTVASYRTNLEVSKSIGSLIIDLDRPTPTSDNSFESLPKREVVLKASVPKDHPPASGPFKYSYWSDATRQGRNGTSSFVAGQARITVPVPGGFSLESGSMSGCWMKQMHQTVVSGPGPFEIELEAIPSGAIYGKVVESDGSEVSDMMVSVLEAAVSPLKKTPGSLGVYVKNGSSTDDGPTLFTAQPLPLGGKYVILAHRRSCYAASEPIALTPAQPIREITLKLPPGQVLKGKVLDDSGKPVCGAGVSLGFESDYSHSFGSQGELTDKNGEFAFERFNAGAPGSYSITVKNVPGYQPKSQKVSVRALPLVVRLKKGAALEGVVLDQVSGNPIPHAEVHAMPEGNSGESLVSLEAKTDASGRFRLTGMAAQRYRVQVYETETPPTTVLGGQAEPLTIQVKPYSWSKLKPVQKE